MTQIILPPGEKGEHPCSSISETLDRVKSTLRAHLEIKDWQGLEIILAVAVAHYVSGEMLWLREIGASRSGKTELLRAIASHPDCAKMEAVTPAALRGGLQGAPKLLDRIDGKLVITKDLATLLTTRKDARTEIFGLLRPIKDGELVSDFGSDEGYLSQTVKFDWIMATTPVFEQYRQLESLLGERFIDLRWRPGKREEMAYRAGLNNPYLDSIIRPQLAADVCSLMGRAKESATTISLSSEEIRPISTYADKAARLRTPVQRDRYHNLTSYPEPEIGTDLTQGYCRIVQGLKLLDIEDFEPYLERLLVDAMPSLRARVYQAVTCGIKDSDKIADVTKLSKREVSYLLDDLKILGEVM